MWGNNPPSRVDLCAHLKRDPRWHLLPVVILTGATDLDARVAGLAAGADDFFSKPVEGLELRTRVASLLQRKALFDTVQRQAAELAAWNRTLEERVRQQVAALERVSRLRRYLPPQVAELLVAQGDEACLASHRQEIAVVFCDLRGFTVLTESAPPEAVLRLLRAYHAAMGHWIGAFEGTWEHFAGDGLLVFFNDPLPCADPAGRAVAMALGMRRSMQALAAQWAQQGYRLGFGVGIALGEATLGQWGYAERWHYGAIGQVPNLAARLCEVAHSGQVLISEAVYQALAGRVQVEGLGALRLKGFRQPVPAYNVLGMVEAQTSLGNGGAQP